MPHDNHVHRAIPSKSRIGDYIGFSVCPWEENPTAQGGKTVHDYCRCGAVRFTNTTGNGRDEVGPWLDPESIRR